MTTLPAISQLAQTTLRSEIGKMELDKSFESREEMHLRCSRIGEADLDATLDQRPDQTFCTVHVLLLPEGTALVSGSPRRLPPFDCPHHNLSELCSGRMSRDLLGHDCIQLIN